MNDTFDDDVSNWNLIVGPQSARNVPLNYLAGMVRMVPVRVVDGGGMLDVSTIRRVTNGYDELIANITVERAASPYQMASALGQMMPMECHVLVLDMLEAFQDETMGAGTRKMVLIECMRNLHRLGRFAVCLVSVHYPMRPDPVFDELLTMLRSQAREIYEVDAEKENDWRATIAEANSFFTRTR